MIRKILCLKCAAKIRPTHPQDVAAGWKSRTVTIKAKKPSVHHITINGVAQEELATLVCDDCSAPITDGSEAVAWTMYRPAREGEPENWEADYQ